MMKKIILARTPKGPPKEKDFLLEELLRPEPQENEVLIKIHYLSLDPYMRGRMDAAKSYTTPIKVGNTMEGGAVRRSNGIKFRKI